jgi:hypothetical protein
MNRFPSAAKKDVPFGLNVHLELAVADSSHIGTRGGDIDS